MYIVKKEVKIALIALPIIFFSNLIIGVILGIGLRHDFFNTVHHFAGGFFVALFMYGYLHEIVDSPKIPWFKKWLIIIGATLTVGVLWEVIEWIGSYYNSQYMSIGSLDDTILDLGSDTLGAIILLLLHPVGRRNSQ
jgi:uncharacterized membrane protein YjdF